MSCQVVSSLYGCYKGNIGVYLLLICLHLFNLIAMQRYSRVNTPNYFYFFFWWFIFSRVACTFCWERCSERCCTLSITPFKLCCGKWNLSTENPFILHFSIRCTVIDNTEGLVTLQKQFLKFWALLTYFCLKKVCICFLCFQFTILLLYCYYFRGCIFIHMIESLDSCMTV